MPGQAYCFFMQDSQGGPFSGIMAYCPDSDLIPSLIRGDSVCFLGVISEFTWPYDPPFYCNMTEIIILPGSFELISQSHSLPPPMIITAGIINSTNGADSLAEGKHGAEFKDMNLAGGIYFYKLAANYFTQTKRMILLK